MKGDILADYERVDGEMPAAHLREFPPGIQKPATCLRQMTPRASKPTLLLRKNLRQAEIACNISDEIPVLVQGYARNTEIARKLSVAERLCPRPFASAREFFEARSHFSTQ